MLATGLPVLRRAVSFALGRKCNRSIAYVAMMRSALLDVALMMVLSRPKPRGDPYLGDDRLVIDPSAFQRRLRRTCRGFLVGIVGKDDPTLLAALFVWSLIVHRRRIVQLPEDVQQIVVRNPRRIVGRFDHFYVSGRVGAYIIVCGAVRCAAHISNAGSRDAGELAKDLLNAPKATHTERRELDGRQLTNEPELHEDPIRYACGYATRRWMTRRAIGTLSGVRRSVKYIRVLLRGRLFGLPTPNRKSRQADSNR